MNEEGTHAPQQQQDDSTTINQIQKNEDQPSLVNIANQEDCKTSPRIRLTLSTVSQQEQQQDDKSASKIIAFIEEFRTPTITISPRKRQDIEKAVLKEEEGEEISSDCHPLSPDTLMTQNTSPLDDYEENGNSNTAITTVSKSQQRDAFRKDLVEKFKDMKQHTATTTTTTTSDLPQQVQSNSTTASSPASATSTSSTSSLTTPGSTSSETGRPRRRSLFKLMRKTPSDSDEVWVASNPYVAEILNPSTPESEEQQQQQSQQPQQQSSLLSSNSIPKIPSSEKLSYVVPKIRTLVYKDLSFYEGEMKNGSVKHGKGTMQYANGDVYDGEFYEDMRHGSGTCKFVTSSILACTGHWEQDKPVEGKEAVILFRNGDRYFGQVKADWSNVSSTSESFLSKALGGSAQSDHTQALNQFMVDHSLNASNSTRITTTPSMLPYIQRHGKGEVHFHNGTKYYGSFSNDHMHGYGVMVYKNEGDMQEKQYYGNWKDSLQEGFGVMIYKDGTIYEGEWKAGNKNGKGILCLPNGDRIEGSWSHDNIKNASYKKGSLKDASRCAKILLRENVHELEKRLDSAKLHFSHINSSTIPGSELMSRNKYKYFFAVYTVQIKTEKKRFAGSSTNLFIQDRRKQIRENSEPLSPISRKSIQDAIQIYLDECLFSKFVHDSHYHKNEEEFDEMMNDAYNSNVLFRITQDFVHLFNWRYHHSFISSQTDAKIQLPNALDDLFSFLNEFKHIVCEVLGVDAVAIYGANKLMYTIKNCVTRRIFNTLFSIYKLCYEEQDIMFKFKLLSLCRISMSELGVSSQFVPDRENNQIFKNPYNDCIKKLRDLSTCFTAHEKFAQLVETHQEVINAIDYNIMSKQKQLSSTRNGTGTNSKEHASQKQVDVGADELFPVYLYVFIRAQLPHLYSEYKFMYDFMDEYVRTTEANYRFTVFENAMNFVQALDVNIRDEKGILVPISQLESRLEKSILDISSQIKMEKKEMPRFLWMSSLFIVIGNYVSNETHNHSLHSDSKPTTSHHSSNNRRLLILDGNHHHVQMLDKYFDYAKIILKCVGVDVCKYEPPPRPVSMEGNSNSRRNPLANMSLYDLNQDGVAGNRGSVEWTNLPRALLRRMNSSNTIPDSPSTLLPTVSTESATDHISNPVFQLVFLQMYPSYVYFSLAKNVENITDHYCN